MSKQKKFYIFLIILLSFVFTSQAQANLTFTQNSIIGTSASTIDLGPANPLSLQTTSNGAIITGTGLFTIGGNLNIIGLTSAGTQCLHISATGLVSGTGSDCGSGGGGTTTNLAGGTAGQFPYQTAAGVTGFSTPNAPNGPLVLDANGNVVVGTTVPGGTSPVSINPITGFSSQATALLLPKWRLALAKVRDASKDAKILFAGDSITFGYGSTSAPNDSYVHGLVSLLSGQFPTADGLGAIQTSACTDSRWTAGTGWSEAQNFGFGQSDYTATSPAGNLVYTPGGGASYDSFDVYYILAPGRGTLTATATGGSATPITLSTGGNPSIRKTTITAGSAGTSNAVTMSLTGLGEVLGIDPFLSTTSRVRFANAGVCGDSAAQWSAILAPNLIYGPDAIKAYAPDLTFILLGVNDASASVSPATFSANLQVMITAAEVSGDVILISMPPSNAYETVEQSYQPVFWALSATNSIPVMDIWTRFGGTFQTNFMYNYAHPNDYGYWDISGALYSLLSFVQ